jgi:hypothetical protein
MIINDKDIFHFHLKIYDENENDIDNNKKNLKQLLRYRELKKTLSKE